MTIALDIWGALSGRNAAETAASLLHEYAGLPISEMGRGYNGSSVYGELLALLMDKAYEDPVETHQTRLGTARAEQAYYPGSPESRLIPWSQLGYTNSLSKRCLTFLTRSC